MTHLLLVDLLTWMAGPALEFACLNSTFHFLAGVALEIATDRLNHYEGGITIRVIEIDARKTSLLASVEDDLPVGRVTNEAASILLAVIIDME